MDRADRLLQQLIAERDNINSQVEALRNQMEGLEIAIKLVSHGSALRPREEHVRAGVSETIIGVLRDSGDASLKPKAIIERAAERGISLNRGSVYALLNRMERAKLVIREDSRYKLPVGSQSNVGDTGAARLRHMLTVLEPRGIAS
jgi:hypothetical protein